MAKGSRIDKFQRGFCWQCRKYKVFVEARSANIGLCVMHEWRRRRGSPLRGPEKLYRSKLTVAAVRRIRKAYAVPKKVRPSLAELGRIYDVDRATIWCAVNRKTWREA